MEQPQLAGYKRVIAKPQDGRDDPVLLESELPLLERFTLAWPRAMLARSVSEAMTARILADASG